MGKNWTKNFQTYPGLGWLNALGKHLGLDIYHFIKVIINVLCLSSVALPCVFRFEVFFSFSFKVFNCKHKRTERVP